jgi:hypothetical protein
MVGLLIRLSLSIPYLKYLLVITGRFNLRLRREERVLRSGMVHATDRVIFGSIPLLLLLSPMLSNLFRTLFKACINALFLGSHLGIVILNPLVLCLILFSTLNSTA